MSRPWTRLKERLIGSPIASAEHEHQLLPKFLALPVFASDALSSTAYATQEILVILAAAGTIAFGYVFPISVVIVGLPLGRPDLETKALIDYYQEKFGKGWEYGYTFPAFNKTLQSAGRCIRTETDRGAIIFLDERYAWQSYYTCFPKEWKIKITLRYEELLKEFFKG